MPRHAGVGLADLVRAFVLLEPGSDDQRRRIAQVLGFQNGPQDRKPRVETHGTVDDHAAKPVQSEPPSKNNAARGPAESPGELLPVSRQVDWMETFATDIEGVKPLPPEELRRMRVPELAPLFKPRLLRDIVIRLGGTDGARGAVDLRRLVADVASARPVRRIAYLPRWTTRRGVQIIADSGEGMQPFIGDIKQLLAAFRQFLGLSLVSLVEVDGSPRRLVGKGWELPVYRRPPGGTPVVLLSALGTCPFATEQIGPAWLELTQRLQAQGSRLCAVVPTHGRLGGMHLPDGLKVVPWSRDTTAGDVRRIVEGRGGRREPGSRRNDVDPAEAQLAELVAPAVQVEPALLRAQRLACLPQSGADVEADLWFSEGVAKRTVGGITLGRDERERLLKDLASRTPERRRLARAEMEKAHQDLPPVLLLEEAANWELVEGRPDKAAEIFKPVHAAIARDSNRRAGLTRWIRETLDRRMPRSLLENPDLRWMHALAVQAAGTRAAAEQASGARLKIGVRVDFDSLELGRLRPDAKLAIEVAAAEPSVQVEVGGRVLGWFRVAVNEIRKVDVGPGPGSIVLRNVFGEEYRPPLQRVLPPFNGVLRIMVSSTRADLMEYREKAAEVIEMLRSEWQDELQIVPISMETAIQTDEREYPVAISKRWVEESDWVVLIVGFNYGTIRNEEGANGISVTEWEYRHAIELGKKVFVFLAGEPDTPDEYTGIGDAKNLALYMARQSEEQGGKMKAFRSLLGEGHSACFRNFGHFSELLSKTLRRAVFDLAPSAKNEPALAKLILSLQDSAFRPCFESIKSLCRCKEIHDALHELRQDVVLPIKDRQFPAWEQKGELTRENERKLSKYREKAGRLLQRIGGLRNELDSERSGRLCQFVGRLTDKLDKLDPWDEEAESYVSVEVFQDRFDDFMARVEAAFSEANAQMQREKSTFEILQIPMLKSLNDAREDDRLSADEKKMLGAEVKNIGVNQERLGAALKVHGRCQRIHDEIVNLQFLVGTRKFLAKCERFCEVNEVEVGRWTGQFLSFQDDDVDVAGELRDGIDAIKFAFSQLEGRYDEDSFTGFCKRFDDSFFQIDKCTLTEIQRARAWVEDLEVNLKKLATSGLEKAK